MGLKRVLGLSLAIAKAEFKAKNEGSYLGILWYLLNPILMFLLLLFIFKDRLGGDIPSYPLYLLLGIIMFNFFQQITQECTKIIRDHRYLIKSINFPHEALVGSSVLKIVLGHIFEVVVLMLFLVIYNVSLSGMVYYPLIFFFFALFTFGSALILAGLAVYFIDIENVWAFVSKLIWLATPIFYAVEGQSNLGLVNRFNPLFYFITIGRDIIVYSRMPELWVIVGAIVSMVIAFALGSIIFSRLKKRFAELL